MSLLSQFTPNIPGAGLGKRIAGLVPADSLRKGALLHVVGTPSLRVSICGCPESDRGADPLVLPGVSPG